MTADSNNKTVRRRAVEWRAAIAVVATVAITAMAAGCGRNSPHGLASRKIAEALPGIIGPAARYDVKVSGDPFALGRGRAKRVVIDGIDVQLSPAVTMDTLQIDAQDISFDRKTQQLNHVGNVTFVGTIGQTHLNNYIAQMKSNIPGLTVRLRERDMEASVPVSAYDTQLTTARLSGTLAPSSAGPTKLDFVAAEASLGKVPVPKRLVNLALERLNPTLELGNMRLPVAVTGVGVEGGKIVVRGTAKLDGVGLR